MEKIFEELEKMRIDAMYGKKKHFNAADRKEQYHHWIGVPAIVINLITGSILLYLITNNAVSFAKYIPLFLVLISTILSFLQLYFNLPIKIEGHRRVANKYLAVMKKCERIQAYIHDDLIKNDEIINKVEIIAIEINEINKEADLYSTKYKDYQKGRAGVIDGEEDYTEKEKSTI
jgi:hypothetical protein